jgi:hypothetical protein
MILDKNKTIELRDKRFLNKEYRGPVALHAPIKIDYRAAFFFNIEDPWKLKTRHIMGVAEIVDVITLDDSNQMEYLLAHYQAIPFNGERIGFVIRNVRVLDHPIDQGGDLGFFDLSEAITERIWNQLK